MLEGTGCFLNVVVADACRDIPTMRSRFKAELPRGMNVCAVPEGEVGSVIAYSCALGQVSWDSSSSSARNGAYTAALLRHLTTPGLHVEDVFTRAAAGCVESTSRTEVPQRPWKSANLLYERVGLF